MDPRISPSEEIRRKNRVMTWWRHENYVAWEKAARLEFLRVLGENFSTILFRYHSKCYITSGSWFRTVWTTFGVHRPKVEIAATIFHPKILTDNQKFPCFRRWNFCNSDSIVPKIIHSVAIMDTRLLAIFGVHRPMVEITDPNFDPKILTETEIFAFEARLFPQS
jgi:hypothetical protein